MKKRGHVEVKGHLGFNQINNGTIILFNKEKVMIHSVQVMDHYP